MRSIRETAQKIKEGSAQTGRAVVGDWGLFLLVILAIVASFGMGRLSVLMAPQSPVLVQNTASAAQVGVGGGVEQGTYPVGAVEGMYVASNTGETYYFPWCAGALKISPEKRRWFMDEKAAQKAGYRAAKNCKGMDSQ